MKRQYDYVIGLLRAWGKWAASGTRYAKRMSCTTGCYFDVIADKYPAKNVRLNSIHLCDDAWRKLKFKERTVLAHVYCYRSADELTAEKAGIPVRFIPDYHDRAVFALADNLGFELV